MRTELQIQASRANGAKSRGPVTPQGKAVSSRNNFRHGLRARVLFTNPEFDPKWIAMLAAYIRELQPQSEIERKLIHTMVLSIWRWNQFKERELQLLALTLAGNSCVLDLLGRLERRCHREYHRTSARLREPRPAGPECDPVFLSAWLGSSANILS